MMSNPTAIQPEHTPCLGVIVPTFNRSDVLIRCMEHLEAQSLKDFEVVVVDDGSTDGTGDAMRAYANRTPLNLRYVRQENAGPAAARNHAITLLRAPLCIMIGDDILVTPDFVAHHVALHERVPAPQAVGLGLTRWSEEGQKVTPFMRWLDESGVQFAYKELLNGAAPNWKHFYTSNLSLKTDHLRAHPFNTGFTQYGMEDIELGYRLAHERELEMHFLPGALGEHVHPTDVDRSCRRMIAAGYSSYEFDRLWPEQAPPASHGWKNALRTILLERHIILPFLRAAARITTRIRCPNFLLERVMVLHYRLGYRQAKASRGNGL